EHDHASPSVFPEDLIRPVGLPDIGNLARRNPSDRRFYEEIAKALRRAHALRQAHGHVEPPIAIDDSRYYAAVGEAAELLDDRDRQDGEAPAEVGYDLSFAARGGFEVYVELRVMDPLRVLIELGTPGAAADRLHFRHFENEPFGYQPNPLGFGERNAGIEQRV